MFIYFQNERRKHILKFLFEISIQKCGIETSEKIVLEIRFRANGVKIHEKYEKHKEINNMIEKRWGTLGYIQ